MRLVPRVTQQVKARCIPPLAQVLHNQCWRDVRKQLAPVPTTGSTLPWRWYSTTGAGTMHSTLVWAQCTRLELVPRRSLYVTELPITVGPHHTPQHVSHLATRLHNTGSLHTTLADAPRVSELRLTIFKAGRASPVLHPCQQSCRHVPMNRCQSEDPRYLRGFGHVERRLHVQARHEGLVLSVESWLQVGPADFLPLPMSHQGLHVFTTDSSLGSHVQTHPLCRLLFFVQQVLQKRRVPF